MCVRACVRAYVRMCVRLKRTGARTPCMPCQPPCCSCDRGVAPPPARVCLHLHACVHPFPRTRLDPSLPRALTARLKCAGGPYLPPAGSRTAGPAAGNWFACWPISLYLKEGPGLAELLPLRPHTRLLGCSWCVCAHSKHATPLPGALAPSQTP